MVVSYIHFYTYVILCILHKYMTTLPNTIAIDALATNENVIRYDCFK